MEGVSNSGRVTLSSAGNEVRCPNLGFAQRNSMAGQPPGDTNTFNDDYDTNAFYPSKRQRLDKKSAYSTSLISHTEACTTWPDRTDYTTPEYLAPGPSCIHQIKEYIFDSVPPSTISFESQNRYQYGSPSGQQPTTSTPAAALETHQHVDEPSINKTQPSRTHALDTGGHLDIVCYGSLDKLDTIHLTNSPVEDLFHWDGQSPLNIGSGQPVAICRKVSEIVSSLVEETGATFDVQLDCLGPSDDSSSQRKFPSFAGTVTTTISLIVYGPRYAADDVGAWLDDIGLYLQIPTQCSCNVPYHNPHAITRSAHGVSMTGDFRRDSQIETTRTTFDSSSHHVGHPTPRLYPEARQPTIIQSRLHSHQLQALTFLQNRELGWDLYDERGTNDLWKCKLDAFGREKYHCPLLQEARFKPPAAFRGGILADEMGLGKTCTMLSLIAADHVTEPCREPTIVVVPLPLLQVWEKQIKEHFLPNTISWCTYYGPARSADMFSSCQIVLTTYNTVAKEHKISRRETQTRMILPLFATTWRRVVLDEAHVIKNKRTDVAKAVSALHGNRRWCITGTPIHNRSTDLYSLLRYLGVYPFDNEKVFEATFVEPWATHGDETALHNLQTLMSTITLRRPRATISLPHRDESMCLVSFSDEELHTYEEMKRGVSQSIDIAICEAFGHKSGATYLNALQKINELRYICNHGTQPRPKKLRAQSLEEDVGQHLVNHELDRMFVASADTTNMCGSCGYDLLEDEEETDALLSVMDRRRPRSFPEICPNCQSRTTIAEATSPSALPTPSDCSTEDPNALPYFSSKIQALIDKIQDTKLDEKCVIFSYWTTTLKIIGQAFDAANIPFILYDGSMGRSKRDAVLNSFTDSCDIKAILVSITCGGQGLDLTAANHAFLFEPQWNPMLEEQAMARVHRLGQTKPVHLVRFIVKNSWEEKIVTLQTRKRLLADLIVDNKMVEKGEEARKHLLWLRDLVS